MSKAGLLGSAGSVSHERSLALAEGTPVTLEAFLATLPKVADADNAALDYRAAARLSVKHSKAVSAISKISLTKPTPIDWKAAATDLDELKEVMSLVRRGNQKSGYRWPRNYESEAPVDVDFDTDFRELKSICSVFCVSAFEAQHRGDLALAFEQLTDVAQMSAKLSAERAALPGFARSTMETRIMASTARIISAESPRQATADACGKVLAALGPEQTVLNLVPFECYYDATLITMPHKDPNTGKVVRGVTIPWITPALELDAIRLVRREYQAALTETDPIAFAIRVKEIQAQAYRESSAITRSISSEGLWSEFGDIVATTIVRRRCMRAALRLWSTQGVHIKNADVTEIDPFTNEPLRVSIQPKGFVVYSIGRDRKDDVGRLKNSKTKPGRDEGIAIGRTNAFDTD